MSRGDVTSGIVPIFVPDNPAASSCLFFFRYSVGRNNDITSRGRCCHPALTFCRSITDEMPSLLDKALVWETNVFVVSPILTITLKSHFPLFIILPLLYSPAHRIGSFPKAAHGLLCSLRGNSLNSLYWFSDTPSTMAIPSAPGETTSIRRMYSEAVFGFSQNALCMMVAVESPASARETAPPDLKECIDNFVCSPALLACRLRICDICFADNGYNPRTDGDTVGNKYSFVMFHMLR